MVGMARVFAVAQVEIGDAGHVVGVDEALGLALREAVFNGAGDVFREVGERVGDVLAAVAAAAGLQVFDGLNALRAVLAGEDDGGRVGVEAVGLGGFDGGLADGVNGGLIHGGYSSWVEGGRGEVGYSQP